MIKIDFGDYKQQRLAEMEDVCCSLLQKLQLKDKIIKNIEEILNSHCYFVAEDGAFMMKKDIQQALAELGGE